MCEESIRAISYLRSDKKRFLDWVEKNDIGTSLDSLGFTQDDLDEAHRLEREEPEVNNKIIEEFSLVHEEFKILKLYSYVSDFYGSAKIGDNTRDFCKRMVNITKNNFISFNEITAFNSSNKGFGKGGSDTYSVFNFRGGVNCKHRWKKYLVDTINKRLVVAPANEQPPAPPVERINK